MEGGSWNWEVGLWNWESRMRVIVKLRFNKEPQNNEFRSAEYRRVVSLCSVFFKLTEYIPSIFEIHDSIFAFNKYHKKGIY